MGTLVFRFTRRLCSQLHRSRRRVMSVAAVVHARAPRLGARVCSRSRATTRWHAVPLVAKRHPPRPSAAKNEIEIHPFSIDTDGSYLVTGAVGFIGSHVCELLMSKGASVVAVDNFDSGGPYPVPWKEANLKVLEVSISHLPHSAD